MAPSTTTFKGALRTKRKPDLLQIAEALGLSHDQNTRRDDLESAIHQHLIANRSALQPDDRYEGLYNSIDKSERRSARPSVAADSESDNGSPPSPNRGPRKHTQKASATINGVANTVAAEAEKAAAEAASLGSQIKTKARKSVDNLTSLFQANAAEARQEAQEVVSDVEDFGHRIKARLRTITRRTEKNLGKHWKRAQTFASDSGNLVRLQLAIEFIVLVLTVLPTHYVHLGESTTANILKHGKLHSSVPHWAITLPDLRGVITLAFWQPILLWVFWALLLPDVACHLVTFQRRHEGSNVTFTYVRLALLVFLTSHVPASVPRTLGVAAGQPVASQLGLLENIRANFSYDWVPLDHNAQIYATALAAGIATYEAIATRPRAA